MCYNLHSLQEKLLFAFTIIIHKPTYTKSHIFLHTINKYFPLNIFFCLIWFLHKQLNIFCTIEKMQTLVSQNKIEHWPLTYFSFLLSFVSVIFGTFRFFRLFFFGHFIPFIPLYYPVYLHIHSHSTLTMDTQQVISIVYYWSYSVVFGHLCLC